MNQVATLVRCSAGWRRRSVALGAGGASVLAMAPFFAWPVLFVTVPVLVWLVDGVAERHDLSAVQRVVRAAGAGWWFGFGYFLAGLFWIGEAFLVEAEKFAVLMPFAVCLLPAGLALFWATATAAASLLWRHDLRRVVVLAIALSVAEWLRGHLFSGLPWNTLGYALTWPLVLTQSAALLGIYGLTLVAGIAFAAPAVAWLDVSEGRASDRWRAIGFLMAAAPIALLGAYGFIRLGEPDPPAVGGVRVRIVQPSVPQREKWRPENQERIFLEHLELSRRAGEAAQSPTLIVWPEAAMPFLPLQRPRALAEIGRMLPPAAHLASGALRLEEAGQGNRRRIYNSLIVFDETGQPTAIYDKVHLVPFGEYLPLQALLEAIGLEQLTRIRGGFDTGVVPRPLLHIPGLPPIEPLICYEAIFPGEIVQGGQRPAVLLNVTNDGWFGNTTGPRQHLHQARVRAVEQGLPLLRAANNGISAVIDAKGRVLHRLGLDEKGVIDSSLPGALDPPLYARLGDWGFVLLLGAAAASILVGGGGYERPLRHPGDAPKVAQLGIDDDGTSRKTPG